MESTIEYSIAREALDMTSLYQSNSNNQRKDNSGRIRQTNPIKNPFTQHSKSSAVLPTTDQAKLHMKNEMKK